MTPPPIGASSYRGSSVTLPHNTLSDEFSAQHASICNNSSPSIAGGAGSCAGSSTAASSFGWDVDGAHTHALVSPVLLNGKKKGGLLSGLKKMFYYHSKADGRAATGEGQRGAIGSVTSSDGTSAALNPTLRGKMDRSMKFPSTLRVQPGSSRDLSLAELLTSPVRGPTAAPGSPAVLNSPMPSMRLDHASSSANLNLNLSPAGGDAVSPNTTSNNNGNAGEQQRRLFPNFSNKNGHHRHPAAGPGAQSAGQLVNSAPSPPATSYSSQLTSSKPSWGQSPLPQHHQHQHQQMHLQHQPDPGLQKSYSTALPLGAMSSSSNLSSALLMRGDSIDEYCSSGFGGSGRIGLPFITSPRNPQEAGSFHSSVHGGGYYYGGGGGGHYHGGGGSYHAGGNYYGGGGSHHGGGCFYGAGGGSGGGGVGSSGGGRGAGTPPAVPEEDDPAAAAGGAGPERGSCGAGVVEEEDDVPGSMLLGMNPAVPAAMRRRKWTLDDYQVVKRMYKGATSAVYRAICLRSGVTVALKVYFLSKVPVNVVHMVRREIELHMPLVHRNIVMLYGAFQDEKHIVLVEEYAARGDLFGIHRSMNCRLTETQTSELILVPFLDALSYLHARGIMHRDIKPENILFTHEWTLKIADFGVSINVQEERAVTRTGTADYMAPEVERCPLKHAPEDNKDNPQLAYTPAIDIWSVGVLTYEMLVGFPPFVSDGQTDEASSCGRGRHGGMAAFLAEQATRKALRFPASVSGPAKDFIMATLNESPGDRPTAQQLLKHPWLFKVARRLSTVSTSRLSNANLLQY